MSVVPTQPGWGGFRFIYDDGDVTGHGYDLLKSNRVAAVPNCGVVPVDVPDAQLAGALAHLRDVQKQRNT